MKKVTINETEYNFDDVVFYMGDDIREELAAEGYDEGKEQAFMDDYLDAHKRVNGDDFAEFIEVVL